MISIDTVCNAQCTIIAKLVLVNQSSINSPHMKKSLNQADLLCVKDADAEMLQLDQRSQRMVSVLATVTYCNLLNKIF